jgi:hypothetical protein
VSERSQIVRDILRAKAIVDAAPAFSIPEPVAHHPRVLLCQCGANEQAIAYGMIDFLGAIKHDDGCPAVPR